VDGQEPEASGAHEDGGTAAVEIVVPRVPAAPHRVGPHGWWCGGGGVPRAGERRARFACRIRHMPRRLRALNLLRQWSVQADRDKVSRD